MGKKREPKKLTNYLGEEICLCSEFKRPRTRREMLAAGIIPFATSMIAPSTMHVLSTIVHAQGADPTKCPGDSATDSAANSLVPVVTIVLSGGAAMSSNWIPKDAGGQLLSNYQSVGLGSKSDISKRLTSDFANEVHFYDGSQILEGIRLKAPEAIKNTAFFATAVETRDDTNDKDQSNPIGIEGIIEATGRTGEKFGVLGYTDSSRKTGHYHSFAGIKPSVPIVINSITDIKNAVGPTEGALGRLSQSDRTKLMKMIDKLSEMQKRKLASMSGGKNLMALVGCATGKNIALLSDSENRGVLDPRLDDTINTAYNDLWGIDANSNDKGLFPKSKKSLRFLSTNSLVNASVVYNTLKGNAITCSLQVGGCDYHGQSRLKTDQKDLQAGELIGRVLQSAALMNKKLFLHVITDGAVSSRSDELGAPFTSDDGTKSAFYTLLFDPDTANNNQLVQTKKQIGYYNKACSVDTGTLIGENSELAAMAVVYNYLLFSYNNVAKANAEFDKILPNTFTPEQKAQIIKMYITSTG